MVEESIRRDADDLAHSILRGEVTKVYSGTSLDALAACYVAAIKACEESRRLLRDMGSEWPGTMSISARQLAEKMDSVLGGPAGCEVLEEAEESRWC